MEHSKAIILLGVSIEDARDMELIEERYFEEVFKITSFFLNRMFIPRLAKAKMKRLMGLHSAYTVLGGETPKQEVYRPVDALHSTTLDSLVEEMLNSEAQLKLDLARAIHAKPASQCFDNWIALFSSYHENYIAIYSSLTQNEPVDLSATLYMEYAELLSEVKKNNYSGWALMEYSRLIKISI